MKLIKFSLLGDPDPAPLSLELMSDAELDRRLDSEAAAAKRGREPSAAPGAERARSAGAERLRAPAGERLLRAVC
jgi:hypothetical protein